MLWWRPDASEAVKAHQRALVEQVGRDCRTHDIAFLLEPPLESGREHETQAHRPAGAIRPAQALCSGKVRGGRRGLDPRRLEDVPREIREGCGAELDGGELPGVPSTVIDLTGPEPRVLREGAVPAEAAMARLAAVPA